MDVAAWLQDLGLERYVPAFRGNEIDWEVLPKLTSEDLRNAAMTFLALCAVTASLLLTKR